MTSAGEFVQSLAELVAIVGEPNERAANKARSCLHGVDRQWLAASPFCLLATSDGHGRCDVSPKGDPSGFVHVIDDRTIAVPERPGNRRADGLRNVLQNPHVGLIFFIPGREDTLRINGSARIAANAPYFDSMAVAGRRPKLALVVSIEEVFYHCAKALMRAQLWAWQSWAPRKMLSRPEIVQAVEDAGATLEELQRYYGPDYAKGLYRE